VLHTSGLADAALLTLTPAKLIFRLYEHPSILDRVRRYHFLTPQSSAGGMPDIHTAADRIAEIGQVDVAKVRRTLVDQWLQSPNLAGVQHLESADVTMIGEDSMLSGKIDLESDNNLDDANLLRAVYVLQHPTTSREETVMALINCVLGRSVDITQQMRALRCLFLLTDVTTVYQISSQRNWAELLTNLIYTFQLRRLRVLPPSASFDSVDRSGLVRALCRSHDDQARRVAASFAADFQIHDASIWTAIICQLPVSDTDVLLQPLPCHGSDVTEAICGLVLRWLKSDLVDVPTAVKVCLLLRNCPSFVSRDVILSCAVAFSRHNLPMCCLTCLQMLPRHDPDVARLHDSVAALRSSMVGGVSAEMAEFVRSEHILSTRL